MKSDKLKLVYIGNYPPRQCGIGTFTENLVRSVCSAVKPSGIELQSEIVAMNNGVVHTYPKEVSLTIQEDTPKDYRKAAAYVNSQADACILQHEYGIFGKDHGRLILQLVQELSVPLIVTLHTVLKTPSEPQKRIVQILADKAYQLVVMSRKAKMFLQESYGIASDKVSIIEHGVPDFSRGSRKELRERFDFADKKIMLTFGLLGPGKGIETMIRALPKVVEEFPEAEYWVLGKTHPNILKQEGEKYRENLMEMADSLGVG
ncbi:MAG: glycosyltransferase, partial [Sinomicrobium sp.]|nr:glycosyltransferase [Sinomicrobium sp.]